MATDVNANPTSTPVAAPQSDDPANVLKNMSREQATRVFQNQMKMEKYDDDMKPKLVPFEAGEVFLEEMPYLAALEDRHRGKRCDFCFKSPETSKIKSVKACSKCKFMFYCGTDCQRRDWKLHKNECARILAMDRQLVTRLVNQFTRIMARMIDLDVMGESRKPSQFYKRTFWDLESHAEDIKGDEERMKKVDLVSEILEYFMRVPDPTVMLQYNRDKLLEMYGRFALNNHGATDQLSDSGSSSNQLKASESRRCQFMQGDEEVGAALYLDVSRLDHSCRPNAATYFLGQKCRVYILENAKAENSYGIRDSGLSYFRIAYNVRDVVQQIPADERKADLKKKYYFDCDCGDCTSMKDTAHFVARCPKCDHHQRCNIAQGPGAACGHQTTGEERTRHRNACESVLAKIKEVDELLETQDRQLVLDRSKDWVEFLKIPLRHISPSDQHLFHLVMKMLSSAFFVCPINFRTCLYKDSPDFEVSMLRTISKLGKILKKIMEMKCNEPLIGFYSQVFLGIAGAQKRLEEVDEALEMLRFFRDATRTMKGEDSPYFRLLEAYIAEMNAKHFLRTRPASFKKKQIGRSHEEEADVLLMGAINRLEKLLGPMEYLQQLKDLRSAIPLPEEKRAGE